MKKILPAMFALLAVFLLMVAAIAYYIKVNLSPVDNQAAVADGELRKIGLYDVTTFGADPSGTNDSTQAIRQAMDQAYRSGSSGHPDRGAVFFPGGTYLVTDQLIGLSNREMSRTNANQFIGSTKGARPTLLFKPKTADESFNKPNSPKPFIYFGPLDEGNEAMGMSQGIRNMEIRISNERTAGTIALRLGGAQDNILHNVKIRFEGNGAVGLQDMVGTNSVVQGLEIVGGKVGINGGVAKWPSFNNVVLQNQTDYAITGLTSNGPLPLSGFYIIKDSAPAIKTDSGATGYTHSGGAYALSDGIIEFRNLSDSPAIDNSAGRSVTFQNVYFKNASKLIDSGGDVWTSNSTGWIRTDIYGSVINNTTAQIINGEKRSDHFKGNITTATPPAGLPRKHGVDPADFPSPDVLLERIKSGDKSVVNIADVPGAHAYQKTQDSSGLDAIDSTEAFKSVLAKPEVRFILIPRGIFLVSDTITLGSNVNLIGVTNYLSVIKTHGKWKSSSNVPVVSTVNDKNAVTKLSNLKIMYSVDKDRNWFTAVHWKAGRNSIFYNIMIRPTGGNCSKNDSASKHGNPISEVKISDNGGGKFYGLGPVALGCAKHHEGFRNLLVENTTEPMTLYGLNPEDGEIPVQAEFKNAKNIAVRGFKCEDHPGLKFHQGSDNIALFAVGGCTGVDMDEVERGFASNILAKTHTKNRMLFQEKNGSSTVSLTTKEGLSIYTRGSVNFDVWNLSEYDEPLPTSPTVPVSTNTPTAPGNTNTPKPTATRPPSGNACGKSDLDGDGKFEINDFQAFAQAYGMGNNSCADTSVNYGACGGRDVNKDGILDIIDFGGAGIGFAQRYYPKTSCAL